jgi:hypothetical protein
MTFKKGDQVQTEDGDAGQILFVDKGGLEAQVALKQKSIKIRTDTLRLYKPDDAPAPEAAPVKRRARAARK